MYFTTFCLYTWPWMAHPQSEFFTDTGDGHQSVWNMWRVNHALTVLHQSPWHTNLLHYPYGTTLLGQTMSPFNRVVAIAELCLHHHFAYITTPAGRPPLASGSHAL